MMRAGPIQGGFVRPTAPAIVLALDDCPSCDGYGGHEVDAHLFFLYPDSPTVYRPCARCKGTGESLIECQIAGEERIVEMLECVQ